MKYVRKVTLAFALAAMTLSSPVLAHNPKAVDGQTAQAAVADGGYAYWLHMPKGYEADKKARWPLMIFLHGSGERGSEIEKVKVHGPPKVAARDPNFPFILISPQLPEEEDWDLKKLDAILDVAVKNLPVDTSRIYLTGLSRGGHASWRWAAAEPGRFAAVAPVCGRGDPESACAMKDVPIWAFHGDRDDVVPPAGSWDMTTAIRKCGGTNTKLTIYPDLGHNAWDPAYDDPDLYLWLLKHRLTKVDPKAKSKKK